MPKKKKIILSSLAVIILAGAGAVLYHKLSVRSASWGWTQTDWSGSASTTAAASHPGDESGWTYYYSKDDGVATSAGALTLASTTASWTETADADFNLGTKDNTYASSGAVWLKKPTGAACAAGSECTGGYCNASSTCGTCQAFTYGGQEYDTVMIGEQCWMAENLNVGLRINTCDNGPCDPSGDNSCDETCADRGGAVNDQGTDCVSVEKYCYNDATSTYCDTEGGLYQWDQAMCGSEVAGVQGICPDGWHIPTDAEWYELENGLKDAGETCDAGRENVWDCATAGTKLKSGGTSGFDALLAGYRGFSGNFDYRGSNANFWSSSVAGGNAWRRYLNASESRVYRFTNNQASGCSVRCAKD